MGLNGSTINAFTPPCTAWNGVPFSRFIPSGHSGRMQFPDSLFDRRLSLDVGLTAIEPGKKNEKNRRKEHQQSEEPKIGRMFEIDPEIAQAWDQEVQDGRKLVA